MYLLIVTSIVMISACKELTTESRSLRSPNDQAKVAVNYLGDARCEEYLKKLEKTADEIAKVIASNKDSDRHLLNGSDGELITKEYRDSSDRRKNLQLSGDKFFAVNRTVDDEFLTIETIEEKCRRLLLSVDALTTPKIEFTHGVVAKNQQQRFQEDFGDQFGAITCEDDFCRFDKIEKRHFVYLEPAKDQPDIVLQLTYCSTETDDQNSCSSLPVTVENIKFRDEARYNQEEQPPTGETVLPSKINHLYVTFDKSGGSSQFDGKYHFNVSLVSTGGNPLVATKKIEPDKEDPDKHFVAFKVTDICQLLSIDTCEIKQLAKGLLGIKLVFELRQDNPWGADPIIATKDVQLTDPTTIANWFQRQGRISVSGKYSNRMGWTANFIFTNPKYLWLFADSKPRQSANYRLNSKDSSCVAFTATSSRNQIARINRQQLLAHFARCHDRAEDVSDLEFLKTLDLTLTTYLRGVAYSYNLTDSDLENWLHEIGGVQVSRETEANQPSPLVVYFSTSW